jgi:methylated-DNA-protein-cysteine methyltransferase related protein
VTPFTRRVLQVIQAIPRGRVCTYGGVAALAGNSGAARQVVRILHSMSRKHGLPWHRVINARGRIAIRDEEGFRLQQALLREEGVEVTENGKVDLGMYLWTGSEHE